MDFVTKLGIGSALGVLTTVLIANSLLPAVLALLGHKIDRLRVPFLRQVDDSEAAREKTLIARWGRFVTGHARIVFPVVLVVILGLASTSLLVRLGAADQGTQPTEQTSRRAYDLLADGFGAGFNGPIPIVVDVNGDPQAADRIYERVQGLAGVASVGEPQLNDAETVAIVFVTPDSAPQDEETDKLVDRLRDTVVPAATAGGDSVAYVSGQTAAFKDIGDRIFERMPLFLLFIIGVTFIVLAMAFRSIVISTTAAITTILSAFVGFGVLTLVVQEGHLLGLTGLDRTGPIETFVPPIAFAILFGLSMDYMVFLMSRIREEHVHGLRTQEAVEHGIAAIGRVVVAAALIMGTVFAAFILSADRIPKEFGLLLAVAILTDALIVRMTLVPAFLTLFHEKAWYIPRWLNRLLPNVTIEAPHDGEAPRTVDVERPAEAAGRP
jgi:putative drug exporter of the RND superfamily